MSEAKKVEEEASIRDRNKAAGILAKRYGILTENIQINDIPGIVDDISE
jgi:hypothetical protein